MPSNPAHTTNMPNYANNQPKGFKNAIERVAIVGVSKLAPELQAMSIYQSKH